MSYLTTKDLKKSQTNVHCSVWSSKRAADQGYGNVLSGYAYYIFHRWSQMSVERW